VTEILIVDIETTDLSPLHGSIVEVAIVSLNLKTSSRKILFDSVCREDSSETLKRDAWIFNNSTLTFEEVISAGYFQSILPEIQRIVDSYPLGLTAYNLQFDFAFLEDRGLKIKNRLSCPMKLSTDVVKLPSHHPNHGKYKWPKVEEAWNYFFPQTPYKEKHRAADDAYHEAAIVCALYKMGKFPVGSSYDSIMISVETNERVSTEVSSRERKQYNDDTEQRNDSMNYNENILYTDLVNYEWGGFNFEVQLNYEEGELEDHYLNSLLLTEHKHNSSRERKQCNDNTEQRNGSMNYNENILYTDLVNYEWGGFNFEVQLNEEEGELEDSYLNSLLLTEHKLKSIDISFELYNRLLKHTRKSETTAGAVSKVIDFYELPLSKIINCFRDKLKIHYYPNDDYYFKTLLREENYEAYCLRFKIDGSSILEKIKSPMFDNSSRLKTFFPSNDYIIKAFEEDTLELHIAIREFKIENIEKYVESLVSGVKGVRLILSPPS